MAKAPKPKAAPAEAAAEQPYYLQRAHIKDFRSIRDAKVEFKPGLNIIIGANGSGKTNLVRVLGNAINIAENGIVGKGSSFLIIGKQRLSLSYGFETTKNYDDFQSEINIHQPYQQVVTITTNKGQAKGNSVMSVILANYGKLFIKDGPPLYQLIIIHHGLPRHYPMISGRDEFVFSLFADRTGNNEAKFPATILGALSSTLGQVVLNDKAVEISEDAALEKLSRIADFFMQGITRDLISYTPIKGIRISDSLKVYHDKQQNAFVAKGFRFEFKIDNQWLPFHSLSSGTQRMFYIVSELAMPNWSVIEVTSKEKLHRRVTDRVILIEEPELGIHPDQLHKLLLFLREQSEQHQLIITTHSPQVLNMLNDDELDRITICELDEKKGTQFRKLSKKSIATAQKYMQEQGLYLSDYWVYGSLETKK